MEQVEFLNIDLDLESNSDLSPIIQEFGDNLIVMNNKKEKGLHKVSFELAGLNGDPDYLFEKYFKLIDGLSEGGKGLWDGCNKKVFDLGFESGENSGGLQAELPQSIVNKLASLSATIAITVYGLSNENT
jgi:hypothetical protein